MIRAYLHSEPHIMRTRILLRQTTASGHWYWDGAIWKGLEDGMLPAEPDGLLLPHGSVEAVAEAFHPFAGGDREIKRLEQALEREQYRVDKTLDRFLDSQR